MSSACPWLPPLSGHFWAARLQFGLLSMRKMTFGASAVPPEGPRKISMSSARTPGSAKALSISADGNDHFVGALVIPGQGQAVDGTRTATPWSITYLRTSRHRSRTPACPIRCWRTMEFCCWRPRRRHSAPRRSGTRHRWIGEIECEMRIGWMELHSTTMLTLTSGTPSPLTSTQVVLARRRGSAARSSASP